MGIGAMDKIENRLVSRRCFLKTTASLAGVSMIPAALIPDAAAGGMTKAKAHYAVDPKGKPDCDDCVHYIAAKSRKGNGACRLVEGEINPHGWCQYFQP